MRLRTPRLIQYCTAIFSATSTATEPESEKNTRVEIARQQRREPPRQRQRLLVRQPAEHHVRHLPRAGARPPARMCGWL